MTYKQRYEYSNQTVSLTQSTCECVSMRTVIWMQTSELLPTSTIFSVGQKHFFFFGSLRVEKQQGQSEPWISLELLMFLSCICQTDKRVQLQTSFLRIHGLRANEKRAASLGGRYITSFRVHTREVPHFLALHALCKAL